MSDGPIHIPDVLRSRRDAQGRFLQPWGAGHGSRSLADLLRWRLARVRDGIEPDPPASAFPVAQPDVATPRTRGDEVRITWVGHATFVLQIAGVNVLTDPIWSERASPVQWLGPRRLTQPGLPFDALPPVDAVLLSHDHYDHLDEPTVRRLHARFGDAVQWIAPLGHAAWLRARGITRVTELDWWHGTTVEVAGTTLEVTATPAQHWTRRGPGERTRLWASFVAAAAGRRVYFCGDSGYFEGFRSIAGLGPFDAALLPIGAYDPRWFMSTAHMNPEEAVHAWLDLGGAGTFVGMHWGTFRLTDEPALEPPVRARAEWRHRALPPERLWLPHHGETRVIPAT